MKRGPRLTFANVAATVALMIAVGGGTVFAAVQLTKNSVKSRHIAPKAVKNSDIAPNAVTSRKIKNQAVGVGDITVGLLNQVVDLKASAQGGPQSPVNVAGTTPVPLTGTTTFTPGPGQVGALAAEAQFTIASINATSCSPAIALMINGEETRLFANPDGNDTATPVVRLGRDADGPFGIVDPNTPLTVSAILIGDTSCTPQSTLDRLEVRYLAIR